MPSLSISLLQLLPMIYAAALLPVVLARSVRALWLPARVAAFLALLFVVMGGFEAASEGLRNDRLGLLMAGLIGLLAMVIVEYSHRYLEGEAGQRRYVLSLLGTLACVATVVTSTDLYVLVGAWILSSLCLHQLLTFYRDRPQAIVVAHKKFLASRLADICMLMATVLLVRAAGDSNIAVILQVLDVRLQADGQPGWDMQLAALLLAMAVILKSAQLPVHGWLIQVMEAPTPVSALLHAGVVNLGGFLLLRFAPLFSVTVPAQTLLVVVGGLTAMLAALVMMTRVSIKVRLAWSTCAQMRLMLLECGLGLWELALVHLLAHSLYKAYAFLAAGETVAHARHHALHPKVPVPALSSLLVAIVLAGGVLIALQAFVTNLLPGHQLPLVALAILAVGLAPWCLRRGQLVYGLLMFCLLLGTYLLWHEIAGWILAQQLSPAPAALNIFAVALFLTLYLIQAQILANPAGALAKRLYPLAFAGFSLDEHFTRLTFRVWPPRPLHPVAPTHGDRQ
jgi:NAD(P)H-quinone oxidoreductase subunit 5